MADKKEKKRAIVEEISPEFVKETPEEQIEKAETPQVTESADTTEKSETNEETKDTKKEEAHKKIEAPTPPPAPMDESKMSLKLIVFITAFVAVIVGGLIGGVIVFVNGTKQEEASPSPSSEVSLSEATPTPAPIDKSKYTINVQNGSGIGGQGAAVQKILVDDGFKVGSVGNAKTYDYTKTVIQAKSTVDKAYLAALEATLAKTYVTDTEELPSSGATDVVVIVGSEKAK